MLQTAIRKQTKKGRKNKKGSIFIRPCCSPGVIPGYALSKRKSTVIYSRAAMHLKAEGLISEIRWTRREGKRVIDFIVANAQMLIKRRRIARHLPTRRKRNPPNQRKSPALHSICFLRIEICPPWVHRWAKKISSPSSDTSAKLIDAYFELISQGSYIHE